MGRLRHQVDRPRIGRAIARSDEPFQIARERRRIARDVDDQARGQPHDAVDRIGSTDTRRIEDDRIDRRIDRREHIGDRANALLE